MPEERRVVTVLFADVTGSTVLGESLDPEDVRVLLARYYAIARRVIADHGGTVEKFIGDAVMAVFGIPQAHGDDADRALAAALVLRADVGSDPATSSIQLRIGVNTGEVVASRAADAGDFLITGDAVNIAARLQQHAEPGTILVGSRTRAAVAAAFRFGEERHVEVKGKREALIVATLEERTAERRVARMPLVGRDADLAQLALVARRAFGERRPQLVTITAPAGTGKSRLVEEFIERVDRDLPLIVSTAQCLPYGAAVTYLPLRGLARGLLGGSAEADLLSLVRQAFASAGHSSADADRLTRLVGATLGSSSDSDERDRDQLFEAWRVLIQALSRQARMIVVFEDLHWASDSLLDLVDHVTLPRADAPLVMVALARPELLDRRPNWGGGRRNFTSLGLEPLSAAESLQLVGLLTEGLPDAMAKRIVERSGGNPFFTGELVRAYQERKRAGADDAEIVLPDTVHATVLARLDALPEEERRVLEYAAVTGRTARAAAVGALLPDLSPTKIDAALEALADRDLLVGQGPGTYTFRHIVIREVAYATLPRAERVRAHLHLPAWLESYGAEHGEEMAELVAYHYRQAIALSPGGKPPEGLAIDKVVAALERAARVAWTGGAYTEAREQILEAIRLSRPEDHLHLYELLGDVMRFGDVGIEGYRQALAQWESLPDADPRVAARLLVKQLSVIGRWSGSISKYVPQEEVVALETRARALLARAPDPDLTARLACCAAFMVMRYEFDQASIPDVKRNVQAAYDFFAAKGDHDGQSAALDAIASVYRDADGDYVAAIAATQTRLRNAANLDLLERLDAWSVLAWDLVHLGRYDEAVALYDEAARNLRPGETVASLSHVASWSVYAALLSGAWDDVLRLVDGLVERREEGHQVLGRYTTMAWVSGMRVAAARLDATRVARYRSSLIANADLAALTPSTPLYPLYRALLEGDDDAAVAYLNGPVGQPERRAELISSLVFERGSSVPEATLATLEARLPPPPPLLRLRIQLARAVSGSDAALRQAIADLDEGGLIGEAARAAALLAMRTHDAADRAEAERRLAALGDQLFLQRLRESS